MHGVIDTVSTAAFLEVACNLQKRNTHRHSRYNGLRLSFGFYCLLLDARGRQTYQPAIFQLSATAQPDATCNIFCTKTDSQCITSLLRRDLRAPAHTQSLASRFRVYLKHAQTCPGVLQIQKLDGRSRQASSGRLHLRQVAQELQRSISVSTMKHPQDKELLRVCNLLFQRAQQAACSWNQVCTADYHALTIQFSRGELVNLSSTQQESQSFRPSVSRGGSACCWMRRGSVLGMMCLGAEALGSLVLCSAYDWLHPS